MSSRQLEILAGFMLGVLMMAGIRILVDAYSHEPTQAEHEAQRARRWEQLQFAQRLYQEVK